MNNTYHKSVLLKDSIDWLKVKPGEKYIDTTLGGGGHTKALLDLGAWVLGIDLDSEAIDFVKNELKDYKNLYLAKGNFKDIDKIAKVYGFENVSGIVMDLGLSSHQIDDRSRGFSYLGDNALDMRMDTSSKVKASDLLNILGKDELYEIFTKYGEEPRSRVIARDIISARRLKAFEKTSDLTGIIEKAYGFRGEIDMKTKAQVNNRVFQALRIVLNGEIENLSISLPKAVKLLKSGGRLAVISFHSAEDRIVKRAFLDFQKSGLGTVLTQKPILPSFAEITDNRRSKSAKLRVFARTI